MHGNGFYGRLQIPNEQLLHVRWHIFTHDCKQRACNAGGKIALDVDRSLTTVEGHKKGCVDVKVKPENASSHRTMPSYQDITEGVAVLVAPKLNLLNPKISFYIFFL